MAELVEEYKGRYTYRTKDVSFVDEGDADEEEVLFRQDEAWTKSSRKPRLAQKESSKIVLQEENNFTQDLHQTLEWMKNTRNLEKLVLHVSERSRDFESFFPTFTPCFLGNVITDDDLDRVLSEFQTTPQKKSKKKKKKKTLTKAESEVTLTEQDSLLSDKIVIEVCQEPEMFISEEHSRIFLALGEYKDKIDFSKVSKKESCSQEWSQETKNRFHALLLAGEDSSVCVTLRLEHLQAYKWVFERNIVVYGICFRENISSDLARMLTPFSVDDRRWLKSVAELEKSKDWISFLLDVDKATFMDLKELGYQLNSDSKEFDQVLFPTTVAQNLRHASCLFDEKVVLEILPVKEEEISHNSNVVCIMNYSTFVDLGKILSLAQKEGFCLTGMNTIRINKSHINDMFPKNSLDQDLSLIRLKAMKIFCHGPSIALSLHRHRARVAFSWTLESKYEKSLDVPIIFSGSIMLPIDESMTYNWSKIFFPHGPISDIKYTSIGSQLIYKSFPLYYHTTGGADIPTHNRNYDFFTVIFLSISNRISENLQSWGDILSKILQLKSSNVVIRIEKCNLVNCSAKVAREIASGCDLDPLGTLRLIHKLRNGYCLMMRLSTTQALFNKLNETDILQDPHVFYVPQLDGLYNRLNL